MKKTNITKKVSLLFLICVCAGSFFLALPTINDNIDDPNMVVYANADEGWLMDTIWFYYSGEKRPSFRIDSDYGLLMLYLSDFSKLFLSKLVKFTPGTFTLILRWINLVSWIGALICLWRLVGYHFRRGWQQMLAVTLLAVSPTYAYLLNNLKPDALMLLLLILGLDYTLRIIEKPSVIYICAAIIFAALTTIIKYEGPFLLPAVIVALYLAKRFQSNTATIKKSFIFREIKVAYLFPFFIGTVIMALVMGCILFYVRRSNGLTWYAEHGIFGTIKLNPPMLYISLAGLFVMMLSGIIWVLNRTNNPFLKRLMKQTNEIISYASYVSIIFVAAIALFGFKWVINPKYVLMTYVPIGYCAFGMGAITKVAEYGFFSAFIKNISYKIVSFGPIILVLFVFYLIAEIGVWRRNLKDKALFFYKRLTLLAFLVIPFMIIFSMVWMGKHHMIPFYTVVSILAIQGFVIFKSSYNRNRLLKKIATVLLTTLFISNIGINGWGLVKSRLYQFKQKGDVAYEVKNWFRENIPLTASIIAAPYHYVYIPPGYENVKVFNGFTTGDFVGFNQFVDLYKPQFIYYNQTLHQKESLLFFVLEEILPGKNVKLLKIFESSGRQYQRNPEDRFVVYEVFY